MRRKPKKRLCNFYAASCCVCGQGVLAGEGWLYADTTRPRRRNGYFPSKVKCARCHSHKLTNREQVEAIENPQPVPRRWTVFEVNRWIFEVDRQNGKYAGNWVSEELGYEWLDGTIFNVYVTVEGERVQVAGAGFLGRQEGPSSEIERHGVGGRLFTSAAWKRIQEKVFEVIFSA